MHINKSVYIYIYIKRRTHPSQPQIPEYMFLSVRNAKRPIVHAELFVRNAGVQFARVGDEASAVEEGEADGGGGRGEGTHC